MVKLLTSLLIVVGVLLLGVTRTGTAKVDLRRGSLCAKDEHIIFSCFISSSGKQRRAGSNKVVSLCASPNLSKDQGYLQYRFGLPGRVELEFPNSRTGTQRQFRYTHYFRFQVDLTEINFSSDGNQYQIFDTFNGEEKPAISEAGVNVTPANGGKEASFICRTKAKADYGRLSDVLTAEEH